MHTVIVVTPRADLQEEMQSMRIWLDDKMIAPKRLGPRVRAVAGRRINSSRGDPSSFRRDGLTCSSIKSERSPAARSKHVDAPDHLARMIGLFQWPVVAQIAGLFGGSPDAGRQDYVNAGMVVAQSAGEAKAAQVSWQFYVNENNIDMPLGLQNGEHVVGKAALDHDISALTQIFRDHHSRQDPRLDDEDRKRSGRRDGHDIRHDGR
jgi:hypothetical protein